MPARNQTDINRQMSQMEEWSLLRDAEKGETSALQPDSKRHFLIRVERTSQANRDDDLRFIMGFWVRSPEADAAVTQTINQLSFVAKYENLANRKQKGHGQA